MSGCSLESSYFTNNVYSDHTVIIIATTPHVNEERWNKIWVTIQTIVGKSRPLFHWIQLRLTFFLRDCFSIGFLLFCAQHENVKWLIPKRRWTLSNRSFSLVNGWWNGGFSRYYFKVFSNYPVIEVLRNSLPTQRFKSVDKVPTTWLLVQSSVFCDTR